MTEPESRELPYEKVRYKDHEIIISYTPIIKCDRCGYISFYTDPPPEPPECGCPEGRLNEVAYETAYLHLPRYTEIDDQEQLILGIRELAYRLEAMASEGWNRVHHDGKHLEFERYSGKSYADIVIDNPNTEVET